MIDVILEELLLVQKIKSFISKTCTSKITKDEIFKIKNF